MTAIERILTTGQTARTDDAPMPTDEGFMSTQAKMSLADIALGCCLGWLAFRHPTIDWRSEHPSLARHFERVMSRPAFAETVPAEK